MKTTMWRKNGQTGFKIAFEVRYVFSNRGAFVTYEEKHAARLRQEGLKLFPVDRGVTCERSTGMVIYEAKTIPFQIMPFPVYCLSHTQPQEVQ